MIVMENEQNFNENEQVEQNVANAEVQPKVNAEVQPNENAEVQPEVNADAQKNAGEVFNELENNLNKEEQNLDNNLNNVTSSIKEQQDSISSLQQENASLNAKLNYLILQSYPIKRWFGETKIATEFCAKRAFTHIYNFMNYALRLPFEKAGRWLMRGGTRFVAFLRRTGNKIMNYFKQNGFLGLGGAKGRLNKQLRQNKKDYQNALKDAKTPDDINRANEAFIKANENAMNIYSGEISKLEGDLNNALEKIDNFRENNLEKFKKITVKEVWHNVHEANQTRLKNLNDAQKEKLENFTNEFNENLLNQANATISQDQAKATASQDQAKATASQDQAKATVSQDQAKATVNQEQNKTTIFFNLGGLINSTLSYLNKLQANPNLNSEQKQALTNALDGMNLMSNLFSQNVSMNEKQVSPIHMVVSEGNKGKLAQAKQALENEKNDQEKQKTSQNKQATK